MRERGGRTVAMPIERADKDTIQAAIHQHVEIGRLCTRMEGARARGFSNAGFDHETVNHSAANMSGAT